MKLREGYRTVTPYLVVADADRQIQFLQHAFDAELIIRCPAEDGRVMHAEVRIDDSIVMLGESDPRPAHLLIYSEDTDATYRKALAAGAKSVREPSNQSYGDRSAGVEDPSGNVWWIATPMTPTYQ